MSCRNALAARPQPWAGGALCATLIGVQLAHPLAFRDPTLRAAIETAITLSALAATCLFSLSFGQQRRVLDVVVAAGLLELALIDLVSYVLPSAMRLHTVAFSMATPLLGKLFAAAALAAGATLYQDQQVAGDRRTLALALAGSIVAAGIAMAGGFLLRGVLSDLGGVHGHGFSAAVQHPVSLLLVFGTAALLLLAAIKIAGMKQRGDAGFAALLSAGIVVFGAVRLNYLALPTPGVGWVTAREGLRLAGYGLILAAALRQEAAIRREIAEVAATEERRRIARDLHDGLAQDLAFIAAHGDRLAREAGADHPLAIAARRALAVSRGAIADLSASDAPSALDALRQVADELESRFGIRIEVDATGAKLTESAREDVVRIAREAIVNAAKGSALNVQVSLRRNEGRFVLRVCDDGVGIASSEISAHPGFGLRSMHERAGSLGGRLDARPVDDGGTELEVLFS